MRFGPVEPDDPRVAAMRTALLAPNPSAAFGDSHVGRDQALGDRMRFTGFGGATFFEIDRIVGRYYRSLLPGRVIVAAGPQMFARGRQRAWRRMPPDVFALQILPAPLLILEPALVDALLVPGSDEASSPRRLDRHRQAFARLVDRHGERAFATAPPALRRRLAELRAKEQRPVAAVEDSVAWHHMTTLLDRLARLGATVCLVVTPTSKAYRSKAGSRHRAAVDAVRAEAARRDIPFRHAAELDLGLRPGHFLNHDHLNAAGKALYWPAVHDACFGRRSGRKTRKRAGRRRPAPRSGFRALPGGYSEKT